MTHICGISVYPGLILHLLDIYADEVAVSSDRVSRVLYMWLYALLWTEIHKDYEQGYLIH
jgi:hypothetical protein